MKKIAALLLALLLTFSLLPAASAADDSEATAAAETLYALGLFRGTGKHPDGSPIFDLDKTPTRNQAVIMLVRLLGKEEALAGNWELPFTDVSKSSAAYPYIGYAYANGLTNGTGATTYSGTRAIRPNQYVTFLLRALGYVSGEDFQVSAPWGLSDALGITGGQYTSATPFTRSNIALLSNAALSASLKDRNQTLKEKLLQDGTIRAWYEVDELGRLFLKTNLNANPKTGYSVLNRRYYTGGGFNHDGQAGQSSPIVYECTSSFYFGNSSLTTTQTDFYVFNDTDTLWEFWDNWEQPSDDRPGDNGFSQAIASVADHILVKFTLDTDIFVSKTEGRFAVNDFSVTQDRKKGQETYTAFLSVPIQEQGEYGLIYEGGNGQSRSLSYIGRAGDHLSFTREIDHFDKSGSSGTFRITHCVFSQTEDGNIRCNVTVSDPIPYQFGE